MIRATAAHAPALAFIHEAAFPPGETWGADAMALQLELPGAFGFIAQGGMVLARTAADEAEILTLAVLPAMQRTGIARGLLAAAAAQAVSQGAATMFLEVSARNAPARALYASAGYVQTGLRPRYYHDGSDALLLQRAIS